MRRTASATREASKFGQFGMDVSTWLEAVDRDKFPTVDWSHQRIAMFSLTSAALIEIARSLRICIQ